MVGNSVIGKFVRQWREWLGSTTKPGFYLAVISLVVSGGFLFLTLVLNSKTTAPQDIQILHGCLFFLVALLFLTFILPRLHGVSNTVFVLLFVSFILHSLVTFLHFSEVIQLDLPDLSRFQILGSSYLENVFLGTSGVPKASAGALFYGYYVIGNVFLFLGNNPIIVGILNNIFFIFTCVCILKLGRLLFSSYFNEELCALFSLLYPVSYRVLPVPLRESLFLLLSILSVYWYFKSIKGSGVAGGRLVCSGLFALGASLLRPQILPLFALLVPLLPLIHPSLSLQRRLIYFGLLFLLIGAIFIFEVAGFSKYLSFLDLDRISLRTLNVKRESLSDISSSSRLVYLPRLVYNSWVDVVRNFPRLFVLFFFYPFFWVPSAWQFVIVAANTLFVSGMALLSVFNFLRLRELRRVFVGVSAVLLVLSSGFVMVEVNSVAAVRHGMHCTVLFVLMASVVKLRLSKVLWLRSTEDG